MSLQDFEFHYLPSATPATPATFEGETGSKSQESQESQGVPAEKRDKSSPESEPTKEHKQDALILAGILDDDPTISLDDIRSRAAAEGIEGRRFAHGLACLPPKYNATPQKKLAEFLRDQPRPAGALAEEFLDELKTGTKPLPSDMRRWPSGARYVCVLLVRRGKSRQRAIEECRRWFLLGADLRAALAMGWPDAEDLLRAAGEWPRSGGIQGLS